MDRLAKSGRRSNQGSRAQNGDQPEVQAEDERGHQPDVKAGSPVKTPRGHRASLAGLVIMQVTWLGLLSYGVYFIGQLF